MQGFRQAKSFRQVMKIDQIENRTEECVEDGVRAV